MKTRKKILSFALCMLICISLIPLSHAAGDTAVLELDSKRLSAVDKTDDRQFTEETKLDGKNCVKLVPNYSSENAANTAYAIHFKGNLSTAENVCAETYSYAEVDYFYKVPQGKNASADKIRLRPFSGGKWLGYIDAAGLEINKWSTITLDISSASLSSPDAWTQFQLQTFGGLNAEKIAKGEEFYVSGMRFFRESKVSDKKAEGNEVTIKNKVVLELDPKRLSAIDKNDDRQFAEEIKFEGKDSVKLVPNHESENAGNAAYAIHYLSNIKTEENICANTCSYAEVDYFYKVPQGKNASADKIRLRPFSDGKWLGYIDAAGLEINKWSTITLDISSASLSSPDAWTKFQLQTFGGLNAEKIAKGEEFYVSGMRFFNTVETSTEAHDELEDNNLLKQKMFKLIYTMCCLDFPAKPTEPDVPDVPDVPEEPIVERTYSIDYSRFTKSSDDRQIIEKTRLENTDCVKLLPNYGSANASNGAYSLNFSSTLPAADAINADNYNFVQIKYFYKIPEDAAPSNNKIRLRPFSGGKWLGYIDAEGLEVNKWSTLKFNITDTAIDASAVWSQFQLQVFGGLCASKVPVGEEFYISSMILTSEKLPEVYADPIELGYNRLSSVDKNDDRQFAETTALEGINCVKLVPNYNSVNAENTAYAIHYKAFPTADENIGKATYKYAEVNYFYKVPEGQSASADKIRLRPFSGGKWLGYIDAAGLEINKWSTITLDISSASLSGDAAWSQFQLQTFGGLNAARIAEGEEFYLSSVRFFN